MTAYSMRAEADRRGAQLSTTAGAGGGGGAAGILFEADWSTATGTSDSALSDGSTFTGFGNSYNTVLSVISASGLGFPASMSNCLKVKHVAPAGSTAGWTEASGLWSTPAIGTSLFFRYYFMNAIPDSESNNSGTGHHPFETRSTAVGLDAGWTMNFGWTNNGTFPVLVNIVNMGGAKERQWIIRSGGSTISLSKNTVYRQEAEFARTAANTYTVRLWTYDAANTLLYDSSNWATADFPNTPLSTAGVNLAIPNSDTGLTNLRFGINGGGAVAADCYHYFGGVMVRSDQQCGPY